MPLQVFLVSCRDCLWNDSWPQDGHRISTSRLRESVTPFPCMHEMFLSTNFYKISLNLASSVMVIKTRSPVCLFPEAISYWFSTPQKWHVYITIACGHWLQYVVCWRNCRAVKHHSSTGEENNSKTISSSDTWGQNKRTGPHLRSLN